ncbi:MAG: MBL fold metallo-hydrolase [Planctomycetota bacterium]|jgi:glyoxylase-like metal-dependent hydrolase (beta-lactamase superfamily II)
MEIEKLVISDYETNCYVVRTDADSRDCFLVDTGLEAEPILDYLEKMELTPSAVVLTHGHADHIVGLGEVRVKYPDIKVYIHREDGSMLTDRKDNLCELVGLDFQTEAADVLLEDGDVVAECGIELQVLYTPGHTRGGICLYCEKEGKVFTGDSLFADSIGRIDFPGGNYEQLMQSIKNKLLTLSDETVCLPGHGMRTTIGREKRSNPFLQQ